MRKLFFAPFCNILLVFFLHLIFEFLYSLSLWEAFWDVVMENPKVTGCRAAYQISYSQLGQFSVNECLISPPPHSAKNFTSAAIAACSANFP